MFPWKERRREEFSFSGLESFQKCHIPVLEKHPDVAPQLVMGEILLLPTPFGLYASCCVRTLCEEQNKSAAEELAEMLLLLLLMQGFLVCLWAEGRW